MVLQRIQSFLASKAWQQEHGAGLSHFLYSCEVEKNKVGPVYKLPKPTPSDIAMFFYLNILFYHIPKQCHLFKYTSLPRTFHLQNNNKTKQ